MVQNKVYTKCKKKTKNKNKQKHNRKHLNNNTTEMKVFTGEKEEIP
jgi:hypothetical protein